MRKKFVIIFITLFIVGSMGFLFLQSIDIKEEIMNSSQSYIIKCTYTASDTDCYRIDFTTEDEIQELAKTFDNQRLFPIPFVKNGHSYPLTTYHLVTNGNTEKWIELYSDSTLLVNGDGYFSFDFNDFYNKIEQGYMTKEPVEI